MEGTRLLRLGSTGDTLGPMTNTESASWLKTKWSSDDLHKKWVAFRILAEDDRRIYGVGRFDVSVSPDVDDLKRIDIVVEEFNSIGTLTTTHCLRQDAESKITRNPQGSQYEYSVFLW